MTVLDQAHGRSWAAYNVDTVEFTATTPDNSIDLSIYSPPFAHLFIYSQSERDMGNVATEREFFDSYQHLARQLLRITRPGRLCAVHCSDLPRTKEKHGVIGLYDFPSDVRACHEAAGWTYVSRITIWKNPVVEMQRTKALGLLYKQIQTDATRNRQGMPDYVLIFRKTPESEDEVTGGVLRVAQKPAEFPVDVWQEWASPVWMSIDQTNVLNVKMAKDEKDERHLCPLQLDLIERIIRLWTNPGETVYSPFAGIGSEGYVAVRHGRRFIGTELKPSYFRQQVRYLKEAELNPATGGLFAGLAAREAANVAADAAQQAGEAAE
jgi:DNA modification methylase